MISQLSAKYQFCAIHTADTTDGKVTTRASLSVESEKVHRLYMPVGSWLAEYCFMVGGLMLGQRLSNEQSNVGPAKYVAVGPTLNQRLGFGWRMVSVLAGDLEACVPMSTTCCVCHSHDRPWQAAELSLAFQYRRPHALECTATVSARHFKFKRQLKTNLFAQHYGQ